MEDHGTKNDQGKLKWKLSTSPQENDSSDDRQLRVSAYYMLGNTLRALLGVSTLYWDSKFKSDC